MKPSSPFLPLLVLIASMALSSCTSLPSNMGSNAPATIVSDQNAARTLLGQHPLSLQWISWNYFGIADVRKIGRTYWISGRQNSRVNSDALIIKGRITQIDASGFTLDGEVTTSVYHVNNGQPVTRTGPLRFQLNGNRRFWRMTQMRNIHGTTDYVDIFFDIHAAQSGTVGGTL